MIKQSKVEIAVIEEWHRCNFMKERTGLFLLV